jgi:3D (Asp-Asp-Asp) domain-containing protein
MRSAALVGLLVWLALPGRLLADCNTRTMRVTFYTCAEGHAHCLTKKGHQPIPFRTIAVGDRALLGKWLYVEDLGGWVLASDTGGRLKPDSVDVFIGDARMVPHARRLGVQHWRVRVCPAPTPVSPESPPPAETSAETGEPAPRR